MGDVPDALSNGIAEFAAEEPEAKGDGPQARRSSGEGAVPGKRL